MQPFDRKKRAKPAANADQLPPQAHKSLFVQPPAMTSRASARPTAPSYKRRSFGRDITNQPHMLNQAAMGYPAESFRSKIASARDCPDGAGSKNSSSEPTSLNSRFAPSLNQQHYLQELARAQQQQLHMPNFYTSRTSSKDLGRAKATSQASAPTATSTKAATCQSQRLFAGAESSQPQPTGGFKKFGNAVGNSGQQPL